MKPATTAEQDSARMALVKLREALALLTICDSPKTAARVRAAIKSCEGAVRHIDRRAAVPQP